MKRSHFRALALLAAVFATAACTPPDLTNRTVIFLAPDAGETPIEFQVRVRQAFNLARPGTILEFGAGHFDFTAGLSVSASHVIVRGAGMDATELDFSASDAAEGILVTGDHFLIHDIAVLEPPGDGVKAVGIDGFTARRVRVEWASFADPNNGPYGIYPVLSENILVEYCLVRGAEDAAIYVGQSSNALVQYNHVDGNVAGIEIENTIHAEVRYNVATENAAGVLVFDLEGLSQAGRSTRVHGNQIYDNNGVNFGHGFLALVPSGTGVLIVSTDDVEIYDNDIYDNQSLGIGVISYELSFLPFNRATFDAWPETIHVHDNRLSNNGQSPDGVVANVVAFQFNPEKIPHIFWDSITPSDGTNPLPGRVHESGPYAGFPLPDLQMCVRNNTRDGDTPAQIANQHLFGTMGLGPDGTRFDTAFFDCTHPPVAPVVIPPAPPVPELADELSPEETEALCSAVTVGPNWAAFEANCPSLADYNLFENGDPTGPALGGGLWYDLTTPLFSDYTKKYRFVFVPPGEAAAYHPDGVFDFPVGTIISKTFSFDLPAGGEYVVETRLLIRRESGWKSLVYLWDEGMDHATYTPEGAVVEVTFRHPDGNPRTIDYGVPDVNQCAGCHEGNADAMNVIGPKARLLNRPPPFEKDGNQLVQWEAAGALTGLPALESVDRLATWDDRWAWTLEERARAYLESNCAHCHRPGGRAGFTSLWLDIETTEPFNLGFCKSPIAAGPGAGGLDFDIVPGSSADSILSFRLDSATPAIEMPELAKAIVHDEGVALVNAWIDSLEPTGCE